MGRSPTEVFQSIIATNSSVGDSPTHLYVVAFDVDRSNFTGLEAQGAKVFGAANAKELSDVLTTTEKMILEAEPAYPSATPNQQ